MPDTIETLVEEVLPRLQGFGRLDRLWFVTTLLDELGFAHGVGAHDDPVENVRDVGEGFITTVALAVRREPDRKSAAYRAALEVLVGLLDVVRESLPDDLQWELGKQPLGPIASPPVERYSASRT